eukprot:5731835-Amphidinium_carterae.1
MYISFLSSLPDLDLASGSETDDFVTSALGKRGVPAGGFYSVVDDGFEDCDALSSPAESCDEDGEDAEDAEEEQAEPRRRSARLRGLPPE